MRRRSLLSAEQRACLFAVPTTPAEMAKHYVLRPEDLLLVRTKRRAFNRLASPSSSACCATRDRASVPASTCPRRWCGFVAAQLEILPVAFADYARRDQTRREHAVELQAILGLRSFRVPKAADRRRPRRGRSRSPGRDDPCGASGCRRPPRPWRRCRLPRGRRM